MDVLITLITNMCQNITLYSINIYSYISIKNAVKAEKESHYPSGLEVYQLDV